MTDIRGIVQQDTYTSAGEQAFIGARANPRGELVTPDWMTQLVMDGRVYNVSNAARETALAVGGTSFSDTAPAFLLDVPSGTTIVPLEINLHQGGTVAGAVITVLVTLSDKIRYSSSGTSHTPQNMRFDEPNSSDCSFYTGATAGANTDDITIWGAQLEANVDSQANGKVEWSARNYIPPVLVGPASLVIYTYAGTTQPSWFFSINWWELSTANLT